MKSRKIQIMGVLGLACRKDGSFLITQRNQPQSPKVHDKWQVPGGGVEFGETPEQTLTRELNEELNVTPKIIFPYPIVKSQHWQVGYLEEQVMLMCYLIDIGNQEIRIGDPETKTIAWVKIDELSAYKCLPLTETFLRDAQKILIKNRLLPMLQ